MSLRFPPLLHGRPVAESAMAEAERQARAGCEAGLVTYTLGPDRVEAALVLVPEVPLARAMAMLPLAGIGFQNALGALAPPEVAVFLSCDGRIMVNGAACGRLCVKSAGTGPDQTVPWLIVGFRVALLPDRDDMGAVPDRTALYAEGCVDLDPGGLVEAWARHTLHAIHRWEDGDLKGLHDEWRALAHGIGDAVRIAGEDGVFLGIDESFGLLLKTDTRTRLVPLTHLLSETA